MTATSAALLHLQQALDAPHQEGIPLGNWRWVVRQRMASVRDSLVAEGEHWSDGWLAARGGAMLRERNTLLTRLAALGPRCSRAPRSTGSATDLKRLLVDISHHLQRLHDLAYDEVELELGGSE